tara:strand:+ start:1021 stop:1224 length:204 start_codon:yes stop_codon:yes gene_type:complete
MGWLLRMHLGDEETFIQLFKLLSIGFLHPKDDELKVKGLMFGFWRFQFQLTLAYDKRTLNLGEVYEA